MRKLPVPILIVLVAAILLLVLWLLFFRDYQHAKAPLLEAPRLSKPSGLTVWAYGDPATVERYKSAIQGLQPVYPQPIQLRIFSTHDQMWTQLREAAGTHHLPDVFLGELPDLVPLYLAQQLSPLSLRDTPAQEWNPEIFKAFVRGEALLAYPSEYSLLVLYFNRRHFDRLGLAYADTYWTWDTMVEIARAVYRDPTDPKGVIYGLEYHPDLALWNAMAWQSGQGLYDGSRWLWDQSNNGGPVLDSLAFLVGLHRDYTFCALSSQADLPTRFLQGQAAMTIAGPALRTALRKETDLQWGCTVLPHKIQPATPLRLRGWAISAQSGSIDAAQGVARTLSAIVDESWLPARVVAGAADSAESYQSVFQISLRYALPPYTGPSSPTVTNLVDRALESLPSSPSLTAEGLVTQLQAGLRDLPTPLGPSPTVPPAPSVPSGAAPPEHKAPTTTAPAGPPEP